MKSGTQLLGAYISTYSVCKWEIHIRAILFVNSISPSLTAKDWAWAPQHDQAFGLKASAACTVLRYHMSTHIHVSQFSKNSSQRICTIPGILAIRDISLCKTRSWTNQHVIKRQSSTLFISACSFQHVFKHVSEKYGLLWRNKSFNAWTRAFGM